ncbi:MAG: hypothetical protein ACR2JC_09300 [Chloroflexota bacterium]
MMRFRDRFDRSKRRPSTRAQRTGFALFWLVLLSYAYIIPSTPSFNSESHLYVTFGLVDHGSVTIDRYHTRLGDQAYWRGHYYSDKAPGISLLAVPVYAALRLAFPHKRGLGYEAYSHMRYAIPRDTSYIRYAITYILVMLPSALFAVLLWLFLSNFSSRRSWTLVLAGVYSLGTIAFYYSTVFFSHQIAAMLIFGAFLVLHRWVRHAPRDSRAYRGAAVAGFLSAYAIISEYPTIVPAGLLAVYAVYVSAARLRTGLSFVSGGLLPGLIGLSYNVATFGKPLATGYMHVRSGMYHNEVRGGALGLANPASYGLTMPHLDALWEITFGAYRGIFVVSPVLLLFVPGLVRMWRQQDLRLEWWLCVAIVCLYFLMDASHAANLNGWSGGRSVASRHLTPVLPFMIFPLVFGLDRRWFRYALVALGSLSIASMYTIVWAQGDFPASDHNPLVDLVLRHVMHGEVLINWGNLLGLTGVAALLPLWAAASMLLLRIVKLTGSEASSAPAPNPRVREMA